MIFARVGSCRNRALLDLDRRQRDNGYLVVEFQWLGRDEELGKRFAAVLEYAQEATNAVVPEAAEICWQEHEQLKKKMGITTRSKHPVGFAPSS